MPANYNLEYYRGDTLTFYLVLKNSSGAPFSSGELAGYTASFVVATQRGDSPPPAPGGAAGKITCSVNIDVNNSRIACTITKVNGNAMVAGTTYVYNVSVTSPGGDVTTYLTGNVKVTERVVD